MIVCEAYLTVNAAVGSLIGKTCDAGLIYGRSRRHPPAFEIKMC
jgi:hypothetical protein